MNVPPGLQGLRSSNQPSFKGCPSCSHSLYNAGAYKYSVELHFCLPITYSADELIKNIQETNACLFLIMT